MTDGALYPIDSPNDGTVDLDGSCEPWATLYNYELPGDNSEGKNVACTNSENDVTSYLFTKGGQPYYSHVIETINNAYPWYCSWIDITFANNGTIPAKIADGRWVIEDDTAGIMDFLVVDLIEIYIDGTWAGTVSSLDGFQYQLDPCHTVTFKIYFHFCEDIDTDGNGEFDAVMPQGATATFQYAIKWAQWNEVIGDPWTP